MKKLIAILLVSLILISSVFAAGAGEGTTSDTPKIGALLPSLSFDFQLNMSEGIQRAGDEFGYEVVINDYNNDAELMLTGLDTMKSMGVKALYAIFSSPQVASDFMNQNPDIAVINQGTPVDGAKAWTENDYITLGNQFIEALDIFVTENNITSGDIAGLWLETCEIEDNDYYTAMMQIREIIDQRCAEKDGDFEFVASFFPKNDEEASDVTAQILNGYPDVKFFFCFNNGYAIAASNEISAAVSDTSDYFVFSSEGDPESFRLISSGTSPYRACAYADIEESGYQTGLQLIRWIEEGEIENVVVTKALVDSRNVDEYL